MATLGDLIVRVGANIEGFESAMGTVSQRLGAADRAASKAGAGFERIGTRLTSMGMGLTASVTLPLVAAGAASVKFATDFESAMTKSLAIMGDVDYAMRVKMADAAREMAKTSTFSATEAADAFYFLASAGLDAAASVEALPAVTQFAQAGMFNLARATDLLTDAQSALGLTIRDDAVANMENMVKVSDVLVKANTLANASVEQFSTSLTTKAGAALKALGKDVEEGVAVLAAFADQGVKSEQAGTQLSIVLRDLQTKAIKNKDSFESMNIAVFDSQGEMNNLGDIIGDLEGALEGMSDEQKKATLLMLGFSDKSISAMTALLGTSEAIKGYEVELRRAGGTTKDVADKQLQSFSAQMSLLKSRLIDSAITIGNTLIPVIKNLVSALEPVLKGVEGVSKAFAGLDKNVQVVIIGVAAMAAALGPLLIGLGLTSIAIGKALGVMKLMGVALAGLTGASGAGGLGVALASLAPKIAAIGAAISGILPVAASLTAVFAAAFGIDKLLTHIEKYVAKTTEVLLKTEALEIAQKRARTSTEQLSEAFIGAVPNTIRYAEALGMTSRQADLFYARMKGLDDALGDGTADFLLAARVVDDYNASVGALPGQLKKTDEEQQRLNATIRDAQAASDGMKARTIDLSGAYEMMERRASSAGAKAREQVEALRAGKPVLLDFSALSRQAADDTDGLAEEQRRAAEAARAEAKARDAAAKALEDYKDKIIEQAKAYKDYLYQQALLKTKLFELNLEVVKGRDYMRQFTEYLRSGVIPTSGTAARSILAIDEAFGEMLRVGKEIVPVLPDIAAGLALMGDQESNINALGDALRALDVSTSGLSAEEASKHFDTILESGVIVGRKLQEAWVKSMEAEKAATLDAGGRWEDYQEARLQAARAALDAMGGATEKATKQQGAAWANLGQQVSTIFTDLSRSVADLIWQGGKFKDVMVDVFRDLGKAVTRFVVEYLEGKLFTALAKLVDGILPSVGKAMKSALDTGGGISEGVGSAKKAGETAGDVAGIAGAGSSAAGQAAGGFASGASNVAGIITGTISAVANVFSAVYAHRTAERMFLVEQNTRYTFVQLAFIQEKINKHLPVLDGILGGTAIMVDRLANLIDINSTLYGIRELMKRGTTGVSTSSTYQTQMEGTQDVLGSIFERTWTWFSVNTGIYEIRDMMKNWPTMSYAGAGAGGSTYNITINGVGLSGNDPEVITFAKQTAELMKRKGIRGNPGVRG